MFMCFVCGFARLASRIAEWHRAALSVACVGGGRDVGLVCHVTPRPLCRQAPLRTKSSNFDRLHLVFHERGRVWQAGTPPCDLTGASSVLSSAVASLRQRRPVHTLRRAVLWWSEPATSFWWCPVAQVPLGAYRSPSPRGVRVRVRTTQGKCTTPPATPPP